MEKIEEEDKTEYYNTPANLAPKEDEKSVEEKTIDETPADRLKESQLTFCDSAKTFL